MSLSGTGLSGEQSPPRRALIVTNNRDQSVIELESFLLENGFLCQSCNDGNSALTFARRLHPALIFSDILISGIDGLSLCTLIKSDPQIATTAVILRSLVEAEDRAVELGALAFVKAPNKGADLIEPVRALIETDAILEPALTF